MNQLLFFFFFLHVEYFLAMTDRSTFHKIILLQTRPKFFKNCDSLIHAKIYLKKTQQLTLPIQYVS